eukprot:CAMPEP_0194298344 /NCGR_PEP_ID=MMETSP0169-20130528/60114_1 /TAXON_ID=218684 /ORGANISM="Corethron pennatum, Strain L29A3" /LENGTH=511 /DNA_ID=CAMNT_0039048321 /DNA_START=218 /DNA_END=1750 /DNA_ORIENTATION=+
MNPLVRVLTLLSLPLLASAQAAATNELQKQERAGNVFVGGDCNDSFENGTDSSTLKEAKKKKLLLPTSTIFDTIASASENTAVCGDPLVISNLVCQYFFDDEYFEDVCKGHFCAPDSKDLFSTRTGGLDEPCKMDQTSCVTDDDGDKLICRWDCAAAGTETIIGVKQPRGKCADLFYLKRNATLCDEDDYYFDCLRACRTVAVSVSSADDCSEPYDDTSFRKTVVCLPQFDLSTKHNDLPIQDLPIQDEPVLIANSVRNDLIKSGSFFKPGIWTDTGHCVMRICGMEELDFEESVRSKVKKIEGGGTVDQKAEQRLIKHRICPDAHNFAEIYGMYSFAQNLRIFDPPALNPQYCRGYDSAHPCGTEHIDRWPGVTCKNGKVISIKISGKKKYGSCCGENKPPLPNKSCILKGVIPSQIKYLKNLEELSLDNHLIKGPIPPIGELDKLKILQLSLNNMDGTLPQDLYSLENLEILDINDNNFMGTISYDIENMKALELVSVYNNKFEGEIPW